jgi:tetratricopeptide (TPR) repeat protein
MAAKHIDPRTTFAPRYLPWLLAVLMLAIYLVTLNHWISFANISWVIKISDWWTPEVLNPVSYLVTYPFRWLPTGVVPLALNLFSVLCATLALGLLARSVAILPHDRTEAQRKREHSDFAFLTIRTAWLPPLLAVLVCGLQLTFWEQATNFTGEMFELLLFAFLIWTLLEYRLDEREWRLFLGSFVCGASLAENWAMVGYFPVFVGAIVWIRGWSFFSWPFLRRMIICGLAGMLLYFLLPAIAVVSSDVPVTFWQVLKINLLPQYEVIKNFVFLILHPVQSAQFLSLIFAYLFPVLVFSLRWPQAFGDRSPIGAGLTSLMFHLVHAVFLVLLIWMAFDTPFSLRQLSGGTPSLTLYYLGALSVGYFCGYFLLLFGKKETARRARKAPPLEFLNPFIFTGVLVLAVAAVAGLTYHNAPMIRSTNGDALWRYALSMERKLPATAGYLVSDDLQRLAMVESILAQHGRAKDFVPLETQSLTAPAYHRFLHKKYPKMWPELVSATQTNILNPLGLIQVLVNLSRTNEIYYLHPSFGYYFEAFYAEPHGLVYKMKLLPEETLLPPKIGKELIDENEAFWSNETAPLFAAIEKNIAPDDPAAPKSPGDKVFNLLQIKRPPSQTVAIVGAFYSRHLDAWAVELQRAGDWERAGSWFQTATNLNPDNLVAKINLEFNKKHRAGETVPVELSRTTPDHFGKFGTWSDLLNVNGPFDEPSFCFCNGLELSRINGFFRQAIVEFDRVQELEPSFVQARFELAQAYLTLRHPGPAFDALQEPLAHPEKFSLAEGNETQLNIIAAAACFQKNDIARGTKLLETELARRPDDNDLQTIAAQVFITHGLFDNALSIVDRKLKSNPNDPNWLYARGYVYIQLKRYDEAVADLTHVLSLQPNNYDAMFNCAIANLDLGNLDAARLDYQRLQQVVSNSVPVAYGLGEIAWRKHETDEAVRNYQIYLANANTNTAEAKTVAERLNSLKR